MRKKDYELIAAALLGEYDSADSRYSRKEYELRVIHRYAVAMSAQALAKAFRADNPRFDADKFLATCKSYPRNPDGSQQPF